MIKKRLLLLSSLLILTVHLSWNPAQASIFDYIWPNRDAKDHRTDLEEFPAIPFELPDRDEKFIVETAKLLGNKLSELDFCQQRVILQLKSSCSSLSDDGLGKIAVKLFNCQSLSHGRRTYPCTDIMTLQDCTQNMDPEAFNIFNIITNRAKAVCFTVRQEQFRGLTEIAVNKLMHSVLDHMQKLAQIQKTQDQFHSTGLASIEEISENSLRILKNQDEVMKLIENQKMTLSQNLRHLSREKSVLESGERQLLMFLNVIRQQIEKNLIAVKEKKHAAESVYKELVNDFGELESVVEKIWKRLETASISLAEHDKQTHDQISQTQEGLSDLHHMVLNISFVIQDFRREYYEKVQWFKDQFGAKDDNFARNFSLLAIHIIYLILGMLCLVFLNSNSSSRIIFLITVFSNFTGTIYDLFELNISLLTQTIITILITYHLVNKLTKYDLLKYLKLENEPEDNQRSNSRKESLPERTVSSTRPKLLAYGNGISTIHKAPYVSKRSRENSVTHFEAANKRRLEQNGNSNTVILRTSSNEEQRSSDHSRSSTPSLTSSSNYNMNNRCKAITARGMQCQKTVWSQGEFCNIHDRLSKSSERSVIAQNN